MIVLSTRLITDGLARTVLASWYSRAFLLLCVAARSSCIVCSHCFIHNNQNRTLELETSKYRRYLVYLLPRLASLIVYVIFILVAIQLKNSKSFISRFCIETERILASRVILRPNTAASGRRDGGAARVGATHFS